MRLWAIALLALFASSAFASTHDPAQITALYNSNVGALPDFAKGLIANENIHLFFTPLSGTRTEWAAVTHDALITEASAWKDTNANGNHDGWEMAGRAPSMNMHISEAAAQRIANSNDKLTAFKSEWGNEIRVEPLNIMGHIKLFIMNIGMFIAGIFNVPQQPVARQKAGAVCKHGGECETGNCIYVSGQGAERTYKCSCDPFKYDDWSC